MTFDVNMPARLGQPPAAPRQAPVRRYLWIAATGIGAALTVMVAVSLARQSWTGPPLPMPAVGPPFDLVRWHLSQPTVALALWVSTLAGATGVAAGLVAARRGARPPIWPLIAVAGLAIVALTVLPPVGSTDSLDYMSFGRMLALGHSPYVMVPLDLIRAHGPLARSIPWEWDHYPSSYGPAASAEQYVAALLGGTSAARIVFWLKLANAIAFAGVAAAADRMLRHDPAARLRAHLLWTANPLLIWQLLASAHIDVLAAAAGMAGLLVAGGRAIGAGPAPARRPLAGPVLTHPRAARIIAGGLLIGLAADIKITFALFGVGLAWTLRRSPGAALAAIAAMVAVVVPSYAWFGTPAITAITSRANQSTADTFYQLFSHARSGFLLTHLGVIAAVLAVAIGIIALTRLPVRDSAQPAVFAALALSTAWLFVWQYQLPWYDAMIICLLILVPACWLDWLVMARLTATTIALQPGSQAPITQRLLATVGRVNFQLLSPLVLLGAAGCLVAGCLLGSRAGTPSATTAAAAPTRKVSDRGR